MSCVTINLTKAEIAYNSSGSHLNNWLRNTLNYKLLKSQFNFDCVSVVINKYSMIDE